MARRRWRPRGDLPALELRRRRGGRRGLPRRATRLGTDRCRPRAAETSESRDGSRRSRDSPAHPHRRRPQPAGRRPTRCAERSRASASPAVVAILDDKDAAAMLQRAAAAVRQRRLHHARRTRARFRRRHSSRCPPSWTARPARSSRIRSAALERARRLGGRRPGHRLDLPDRRPGHRASRRASLDTVRP